jgi:hypothetical protein
MDVLSPLAISRGVVRALARRRRSLAGLRIGVLDNSKPNAGVLLGTVAELIAARADGATIQRWTKPGASIPSTQIDEIVAHADVLLTGSAD